MLRTRELCAGPRGNTDGNAVGFGMDHTSFVGRLLGSYLETRAGEAIRHHAANKNTWRNDPDERAVRRRSRSDFSAFDRLGASMVDSSILSIGPFSRLLRRAHGDQRLPPVA